MNKQKRIEAEEIFSILSDTINGANFDDLHDAVYRIVDIAGYRKQSGWISVNERLPERPGAYLVFTCDRRISMCHFIDHYCDGDMQFDDYRVTHWMPLPEAPKGGAE